MRLSLVLVGIALIVPGAVLIILGTNELLAVNDCSAGGYRYCVVRLGSGICNQYICTIDPFFGQNTLEGIRVLGYSLIEIGAVIAGAGVVLAVIGRRTKTTSNK